MNPESAVHLRGRDKTDSTALQQVKTNTLIKKIKAIKKMQKSIMPYLLERLFPYQTLNPSFS